MCASPYLLKHKAEPVLNGAWSQCTTTSVNPYLTLTLAHSPLPCAHWAVAILLLLCSNPQFMATGLSCFLFTLCGVLIPPVCTELCCSASQISIQLTSQMSLDHPTWSSLFTTLTPCPILVWLVSPIAEVTFLHSPDISRILFLIHCLHRLDCRAVFCV